MVTHTLALIITCDTDFYALIESTEEFRARVALVHEVTPIVTVENVILQLHEYQALADCVPDPYSLAQRGYLGRRMPKIENGFPRKEQHSLQIY